MYYQLYNHDYFSVIRNKKVVELARKYFPEVCRPDYKPKKKKGKKVNVIIIIMTTVTVLSDIYDWQTYIYNLTCTVLVTTIDALQHFETG